MSNKSILIITGVLYAIFSGWYTHLGGPMTNQEIDQAIVGLTKNGMKKEDLQKWEKFMRTDTGNQFIMLNAIDMNPSPPKMPKTRQGAGPEELMNIYMEHMYAEQFKRASHPVFFGHAVHTVLDIAGIDNATSWTHGALFRYRSRADLIEIALHPSSYERHEYKIAALTKTIAYPIEPTIYLSDLRFLVLLIMSLIYVSIVAIRR